MMTVIVGCAAGVIGLIVGYYVGCSQGIDLVRRNIDAEVEKMKGQK